jgi:hypothetical protein
LRSGRKAPISIMRPSNDEQPGPPLNLQHISDVSKASEHHTHQMISRRFSAVCRARCSTK